jgi:hypothetical protein
MRTKLLVFASAVLCVSALTWVRASSDDRRDDDQDEARIAQGFAIAPVTLHFAREDRDLVGLGSYVVNAIGGCNDCHTNPSYAHGGNPFMGQPKQINTTHYLAGGMVFGPFTSRNITPGRGLPETFAEFLQIFRHGTDFEHLHPQFGPLLQVMPWPTFQSMKQHDIQAIYTYLRAIPPATACASVGPTAPDPTCRP